MTGGPEGGRSRTDRLYWALHLGGWAGFALLHYLVVFLTSPLDPALVVSAVLVPAVAGAGLTHAYGRLVRRRGWGRLRLLALAPRFVAAGVGIALAMFFLYDLAYTASSDFGGWRSVAWHANAISAFFYAVPVFGWSFIYFVYRYAARASEAEAARWRTAAAAHEAELAALRAQLNPHFLFNALNSVRALVSESPERAQEAVTRLSEMLRYALQSGTQATVPLGDEIEAVRTYLALEAIRFEERLQYRVESDEALRDMPVPPMLVQTLVENGVKHGVASCPGGGAITVEAGAMPGGGLRVRVVSTGALGAGATNGTAGTGTGLRNARERLRLLYGDAASLALHDGDGETLAELHLPARPPAALASADP